MFKAFVNCFKVPDLRQKLLLTLSLLFVARIGANIPLPGLDPQPLQDFFADQTAAGEGSLLGLYNMFTGGALLRGAVAALGIMPYISAAIIMQLMTAVVPSLSRLSREGDIGKQKINRYTRIGTLIICLVQGVILILALENPARLFPGYDVNLYGDIVLTGKGFFLINSVIILACGTMILMWLGEQITERGIGNGISLLITVGILADLPGAVSTAYQLFFAPVGVASLGLPEGILMLLLLFTVTAGIVAVTQAQRKIPVQYAKRVIGRKVYGGQSSFLPLKVNYAGVMPVIFASAILLFPQQVFSQLGAVLDLRFLRDFGNAFVHGTWVYYVVMATLILVFSYFWVSVMFKPIQIADDLKKHGGYVPGVRPGEPTAKYLDFVMTRLTLAGAIFLTIIAVFPDILLFSYNIPFQVASFFGGTGMLIIVGVILDFMQRIETFLLQRHYDGFLKKGKVKGRSRAAQQLKSGMNTGEMKNLGVLLWSLGILLALGLGSWVASLFIET